MIKQSCKLHSEYSVMLSETLFLSGDAPDISNKLLRSSSPIWNHVNGTMYLEAIKFSLFMVFNTFEVAYELHLISNQITQNITDTCDVEAVMFCRLLLGAGTAVELILGCERIEWAVGSTTIGCMISGPWISKTFSLFWLYTVESTTLVGVECSWLSGLSEMLCWLD